MNHTPNNSLAAPTATSAPVLACPRCQGTGYLPRFNHVQRGVCFRCGGSGRP